jgi:YebC/PmpR family DNA-binding regulatory protein
MSGHNRWSKIKRQKEAMGATKGKLFTKIIKEITVAARMGGGDPAGNHRLRSAMLAAREANMSRDQIDKAIKKGTGELGDVTFEEVTYEGFGPNGVAFIVECLTDNRNRTAGEVRSTFTKGGGNLGATGSVMHSFARKGVIRVKPGTNVTEEKVMEVALDAGADDVLATSADEGGGFEVRTEPSSLHATGVALEKAGFQLSQSVLTYLPQNTLKLEGDAAAKVLKLIELLEDNDDVQNVHANLEVDDATLEKLA